MKLLIETIQLKILRKEHGNEHRLSYLPQIPGVCTSWGDHLNKFDIPGKQRKKD